ncbi:MAG: glycoside hydrolase family 26 protein [Chloroflexota bacterium]
MRSLLRVLLLAMMLMGSATNRIEATAACRPAVGFDGTSESSGGRYTAMHVTMTATPGGGNRLTRLTLTHIRNGWVQIDGHQVPVPSVIALDTERSTFSLYRTDLAAPFQLDYVVTDSCGDMQRFVGSGQGAVPGNPTPPESTAVPTQQAAPSPTPLPTPTPTPPAADNRIALGTYRPAFPNDLSSVVAYEQASGRRITIIHWYALWGGWKSAFSRSDLETVATRGSVPMITWEPWAGQARDPNWTLRDAILSGRSDAYIESWAQGLAAYGRPVLLRFAHEMHGQSYPWAVGVNGNTDAEYVAAWRYAHGFFERAGATNVQWVWNPNTLWGGTSPAADHLRRWQRLYPGDAYVDWTGLDIYNTGPELNWGAPYWRSFETALSEPYAAMTSLSPRPVLLGEVGSSEIGGDKGRWLAEGFGPSVAARFPQLRAIIWYDINKEQNWAVQSSPGAYNAFISAIQQSHFMADASGLEPLFVASVHTSR